VAAGSLPALTARLREQLEEVRSWKDFLRTPLELDPAALVPEGIRHRLDGLPGMVRLFGDAVPLEYEVSDGAGVVRLRLREGQARRLSASDVPALDRPVRFAVVRGGEPELRAESVEELQELLHRQRQAHAHRHRRRDEPRPRRGGRRRR
jgi:hypothetical protein